MFPVDPVGSFVATFVSTLFIQTFCKIKNRKFQFESKKDQHIPSFPLKFSISTPWREVISKSFLGILRFHSNAIRLRGRWNLLIIRWKQLPINERMRSLPISVVIVIFQLWPSTFLSLLDFQTLESKSQIKILNWNLVCSAKAWNHCPTVWLIKRPL